MDNVEKLQNIIDKVSKVSYKGVYLWKYLEYELTSGICSDYENQENNKAMLGLSDYIPDCPKEMVDETDKLLHMLDEKDILIGMVPMRRFYNGKLVHTAMDAYLQGIDLDKYIVLEPFSSEQNDEIVFTRNRLRYHTLGVISKYGQDLIDDKQIIEFLTEQYIFPIEKEFNIKYPKNILLKCVFKANVIMKERRAFIEFFSEVLNRVKPKVICYTHGPDKLMCFLNEAAQNMGIPTVEIAHGETALNLVYPDWMKCSNYYLTHSDMITKLMRAREIKNVITIGKPGIYDNVSYNVKKKGPIVISFISSLEKDLLLKAINLAKKLDKNKYLVVFKLHPSEHWSDEEMDKILDENSNWQFLDGFVDVRDLYAISDIIVGVRSSGILEALPFHKLKILCLRDKYEDKLLVGNFSYFYELSQLGDITIVEDDDQIYKEVIDYERGKDYRGVINHYWPEDGNERFKNFIQSFMKE